MSFWIRYKPVFVIFPSPDLSVNYSQHNYQQLTSFLKEQANKCSSITKLTTIGTSREGREIYSLVMTVMSAHEAGKAHVGLVGSLQGTDITGKELLLKMIEYLCNKYQGKDDSVTKLLQSTVLHIVPAVDLDGNEKAREGDCSGIMEPKDDLSRSFYFNLTQSKQSTLPKNIEEVRCGDFYLDVLFLMLTVVNGIKGERKISCNQSMVEYK